MADIEKKYLDLAKLGEYDTAIKGKMAADIATEAARAAGVESGLQSAIDTLNGDNTTAGSVAKAVKDGVDALDAQLSAVAKSGDAGDVAYDNTTSELTATDVQTAIDEIAAASAGGVASKSIWVHDDSSGQSAYAKVYNIYQGENDYVAERTDGKTNPILKGTINIPKDKVLQDSSVVDITFSENKLWDGATDVTALIKGSETPTAADAGKYLKMEMQNVTDPLYVNLQTFVDVYTAESGATEIQIDITNHVVSASVVAIDGSKIIYKAETSAGAGDGENVKQALTRLDGSDSTTGSVRKIVKDAIEGLDTPSDVALYSHDSSTGAVTFTGSLAESDGIVAAGSGDNVIFTPITSSEIAALFA